MGGSSVRRYIDDGELGLARGARVCTLGRVDFHYFLTKLPDSVIGPPPPLRAPRGHALAGLPWLILDGQWVPSRPGTPPRYFLSRSNRYASSGPPLPSYANCAISSVKGSV